MSFEALSKDGESVLWNDGQVSGDPVLCGRIAARALMLEGQPVAFPTGPATLTEHLANPLSALQIMLIEMGPGTVVLGDVPMLGTVPPDAVA